MSRGSKAKSRRTQYRNAITRDTPHMSDSTQPLAEPHWK